MPEFSIASSLVIYITVLLGFSFFLRKPKSADDYYLNFRSTPTWIMTCSNIATLIGAGAVITTASTAFTTGISYGLLMVSGLSLAAFLYIPISSRIRKLGANIKTPADALELKLGKKARQTYSILYLFLAVCWGSLQFVAIAYLFQVFLKLDYQGALLCSGLATIVYTSTSGMRGDLYTDVFQLVLMFGLYLIIGIGLWQDGALQSVLSLPSSFYHPFSFGGPVVFLVGVFVAGLVLVPSAHYWLRINSAESEESIRRSFLYSVPAMFLFPAGASLIGLAAISILPKETNPDLVFYEMTKLYAPGPFLGVAVGGILSVMLSSIDSVILGTSAVAASFFSGKQLSSELRTARISSVAAGLLMLGIAAVFPKIVSLTLFTGYFSLCFVPAVILTLYSKKITEKAAVWSIVGGALVLLVIFPFNEKISFVPATFTAWFIAIALSERK